MATLKERYEELFGPTPDYDPIAVADPENLAGQARRRAIDMQAAAPTASPRRAIPEMPTPSAEPQGALSGLFKTGAAKVVAEPLIGAVEYGARQAGLEGVSTALSGVRDDLTQWRESVYSRMNPEVMDMVGRELLTLDPAKTIWRGNPLEVAEAILYKVVEQTPSLLATMIPGAVMLRAGAMGKGISFLGASEAGLSLGAIQNEIADGITQSSTDELMNDSFRFRELMDEHGDEATARAELIREAQGMAPLIGGIAVGAISAAAGRYLAPVFEPAGGAPLGQRIGRAAISEGLFQEGPQESVEQIAANIAAAVYDGDRQMLEGVAESYAQGALLGGIMGGGVGGILGRRPSDTTTTAPELDTPDAPSAFRPGRGGPRGAQLDLPLEGGEGRAFIGEQQDMFEVADELFDDQGNYVGNVASQALRASEDTVDPAIAAAIQANIRSDRKMDDMFQTNPQQEPQYPSQNIQEDWIGPPGPNTGVPARSMTSPITGANEQLEMFPGPEKRSLGNRPVGATTLSAPRRDRLGRVERLMPDMPTPEPEVDIGAQLDQLERGQRDGVYLAPGQQIDESQLNPDYIILRDFAEQGDTVIFADEDVAEYYEGMGDEYGLDGQDENVKQAILGEITGAGVGKPLDGQWVVQQLNKEGGVARESLVSTREEGLQVGKDWGGNTRVLTAAEAVARRERLVAQDMFAPPEPKPQGEVGATPRKLTGRHRVRFVDDTGAVIEDRTFSDVKKANKYADELADTWGLAQKDAGAYITVTPVRTLPKRQTRPTQSEQRKRIEARRKKKEQLTEGEKAASKIRAKFPFDERREMVEAVTPAKTREDAAKNLVRLAGEKLDAERKSSIKGEVHPDALEFKDSELAKEYAAAWEVLAELQQAVYAADFIIANKTVVPLNVRGTVVSKAKRDKQKAEADMPAAVAVLKRVRRAGSPRRRVEKIFREARLTNDEVVQRLGYNADKIAKLLNVDRASLTAEEERSIELLQETQQIGEEFGAVELPTGGDDEVRVYERGQTYKEEKDALKAGRKGVFVEDEAASTMPEGTDTYTDESEYVNVGTTKESLEALSASELQLAFEQALDYRQRVSKRINDDERAAIEQKATSPSLKIKEIMRAVVSMINSSESDARVKAAKIVTDVRNKGGATTTVVRDTKPLTSVTIKGEESQEKLREREEEAKKLYASIREQVPLARARLDRFVPERNESGTLTEEGVDEVMGVYWAESIIQLADAMLFKHLKGVFERRHFDQNALELATSINYALKRIAASKDSMFGTQWAHAARETLKVNAKSWSTDLAALKESVDEWNAKVNAVVDARENREKWKQNSDYRTFIAPIIRKFAESYWNGDKTYYPTLAEAETLAWVLESFRAGDMEYHMYQPMAKLLQTFGFKFKDNKLVVNKTEDGKFDFTPKTAHLLNGRRLSQPIIETARVKPVTDPKRPYDPVTVRTPVPQGELSKRIQDRDTRVKADEVTRERDELNQIRHVRAANIFAAFRKIVENKKSTIRRMAMAESKFLQALKAEGFITQFGSEFVTIKFPHSWNKTLGWQYRTITYRRFGEALNKGRINKDAARGRASAVRKDYTVVKSRIAEKVSDRARLSVDLEPQVFADYIQDKYSSPVYELIGEEVKNHGPKIKEAARVVGDLLNDRSVTRTHTTLLSAIVDTLPESSFYGMMARKLLYEVSYANEIEVAYESGPSTALGRYFHTNNIVLYPDKIAKTSQPEGETIHTLLHEIAHGATVAALEKKPSLLRYVDELANQARQHWIKSRTTAYTGREWRVKSRDKAEEYVWEINLQSADEAAYYERQEDGTYIVRERKAKYDSKPYGLFNTYLSPAEFVAEAFSNPDFQAYLKTVPVDNETLWDKFKAFVKRVLGFSQKPEFDNVMEALLAAESELFSKAGEPASNNRSYELGDSVLAAKGREVFNKWNQTYEVEEKARKAATTVGSAVGRGKMSHAFHTMRQLRERYERWFGGETGPLAKYMDAFNARNARNAELMQFPESLSRKWTNLTDKHGVDTALEFSRIATDSTIHMLDPSLPATHKRNEKSAAAQKDLFNKLRKKYSALPQDFKDLWSEVGEYYQQSLQDEVGLMLLNAVRGVVTQGAGSMPVEVFDSKYNKTNILDIATKEKIIEEFGEHLGEKESDKAGVATEIQRLANVPAMKQGVYFPLMRYGEYAVYAQRQGEKKFFTDNKEAFKWAAEQRAKDPTLQANVRKEGENRYSVQITETEFVVRETITEAEKERERLLEEYGVGNVGDVGRRLELPQEAKIGSNAALTTILGSLEGNAAAQNAIKQFYLRSLSDQSFRKREIKRQNRRGVDYDLQHRNFANYAKQSAYYRAQLEHGWKMAKGMADMAKFLKDYQQGASRMTREQLDNVYLTLKKRDDLTANPIEIHDLVRKGIALTQFYMLTSVSYHVINMTQPWMVTMPTMGGRHGWGNAYSAMKGAQALIKAPIFSGAKEAKGGLSLLPWLRASNSSAEKAFGVFDDLIAALEKNDSRADEHIAMLNELRKTHVLEVSPLTELREIAAGKTSWTSKVLDASRVMAHMVEVNNRVLTAIAAYDLEYVKQKNSGAGEDAARKAATRYAEDMVSTTQFDYSTANKPPAFMKYPLVFQFMQWAQHIYAHMIRNTMKAFHGDKEARNILLGLLGTHAAVGGALGVTLQPIKMAIGIALMAVGDDDEPYTWQNAFTGKSYDRWLTSATNELFGTTASTVMSRGVPAALGFDLSTRMSLGTLFFIDLRGDTPESVAGSLLSSFGGAGVNQLLTFGRGIQYASSGDYDKAIEAFSPKFMRDILRAGRFATDGLVNNSGDTVLNTRDLNYWDVALQAVGFTPTKVGMFYEGQAAIKDKEAYVRKQKINLLREFRTADAGDRADIIDRIVEFNQSFPQEAITRSAILRNMKGKLERELQYERYGAAIDEKKAALYAGYGEPYR